MTTYQLPPEQAARLAIRVPFGMRATSIETTAEIAVAGRSSIPMPRPRSERAFARTPTRAARQ